MSNVPLKSLVFPGLDPTYTIPQKTSDLTNDSGFITAADVPEEVFWAEYGTTTNAEIEAAYQAGKIIFCKYGAYVYQMKWRVDSARHLFYSAQGLLVHGISCMSNVWSNDIGVQLEEAGTCIPMPYDPATGAFLVWNGTAWTAQTLSTWQGGSY